MPLDVRKIAEFRFILDKIEAQMKAEHVHKQREIKRQVDQLSFQGMKEDLDKDMEKIGQYNKSLEEAQDIWADQVQSYKKNRHARGLAAVEELMTTKLNVCGLKSSFLELAQHFGRFRNHAEADGRETFFDRISFSTLQSCSL